MRFSIAPLILIILLSCSRTERNIPVTTVKLIDEMTDLDRLTRLPSKNYRTIQFSSYDRRSKSPNDSCWFSNEDGFGSEPIPGFAEMLEKPDSAGVGEYLICDIKGPGAIVRLWTANINGDIRLFLDNTDEPIFEGSAQDFFWKTMDQLSGKDLGSDYAGIVRQFDATYLPIPFSEKCRIEWIGDITKIHFYHVGIRVYDPEVRVETFKKSDAGIYLEKLKKVKEILSEPDVISEGSDNRVISNESTLRPSDKKVLFSDSGGKAIIRFSVNLKASGIEQALRSNIVTIWFDDSSVPQVEAPLGDFFGAAPGLNPYTSLPFTVMPDGSMICRFLMPFRKNVRIMVENMSDSTVSIHSEVTTGQYLWDEGSSMHFRARWKIDHGITASYFDQKNYNVPDIIYLMVSGKGRIAGAAAFIYNPSNATTSWGNWWGEGDEKIFVDQDTFPSFFGTGSEDYFNYSWSSTKIFSFPYCGQPRNDGPGNRGYVSNYRWHISDDILFHDKLTFCMELGHHGVVPDFSYGRIVYFYTIPGSLDDYSRISVSDVSDLAYMPWMPVAYLGSAGYRYIQAEDMIIKKSSVRIEEEKIAAGKKILAWTPDNRSDKLRFNILSEKGSEKTNIGFTFRHDPAGGIISIYLNGRPVKIDNRTEISLFDEHRTMLANHFTEKVDLKRGLNEVVIESKESGRRIKVGIDFIWMK
ncbi:MAG TPA: glycoside hydrolase family 172 protein [Bacteroidales bacterium]|nr:glycoside hydrolase family 172 protein [Bacteroidales bacterium]